MKTYRPFAALDKDAYLQPATLERIEQVRRLMVRATCVEASTKGKICHLMKWPAAAAADDLSEPDYYLSLIHI